jgi:hypothetical protein
MRASWYQCYSGHTQRQRRRSYKEASPKRADEHNASAGKQGVLTIQVPDLVLAVRRTEKIDAVGRYGNFVGALQTRRTLTPHS